MPNWARLRAVKTLVSSLRTPLPFAAIPPTTTLSYAGPASGMRRLADVWVPPRPSGASVMLVHGGGFILGARNMKPMRVLAHDLVKAGVTVCSIDYRLFPRARVPDMRDDTVLALFWWLDEVRRRDLNAKRVDLLGCSAGGTLVSLANEVAPEGTIRQLTLCFPLLDIEALSGTAVKGLSRALFPKGNRARWSPAAVCRSTTSVVIHQGTADLLVSAPVVDRVVAQMRERGVSVDLHRYEGAAHGFFNDPLSDTALLARRRIVQRTTG